MRKIAIFRIIGLVIVIVCLYQTISAVRSASRIKTQFDNALTARPIDTAIDLSKPGETTTQFLSTYYPAHGIELYLQGDFPPTQDQDLVDLLQGFAGQLIITDDKGNEIQVIQLERENMKSMADEISVAGFWMHEVGEFVATVRVDSPAKALAGTEQSLHAGYRLCGCELLPAFVMNIYAFVMGLSSFFVGIWVTVGFLQYGIYRKPRARTPR